MYRLITESFTKCLRVDYNSSFVYFININELKRDSHEYYVSSQKHQSVKLEV